MLCACVGPNLSQNFQATYLGNVEIQQNEHGQIVHVPACMFPAGKQVIQCFDAIADPDVVAVARRKALQARSASASC